MSNNYLKFPGYFNIGLIEGSGLKVALAQDDLMAYFRSLYSKDTNEFLNLRDECLLRGIEFSNKIRSNNFPALLFQPESIVIVQQNQGLFKKIEEDITGIKVLLNRYHIQSDLFFNLVSIEGLAFFLKKDPQLLMYAFEKAGYQIISIKAIHEQDLILPLNSIQEDIPIPVSRPYTAFDNVPLTELFSGGRFLGFLAYCEKNKIEKFSQLSIDMIENFKHVKGMGETKYRSSKKRFEELLQEIINENQPESEVNNPVSVENPYIYFCENQFKTVLELNQMEYLAYIDALYSEEGFAQFDEKVETMRIKMEYLLIEANRQIENQRIERLIKKIQALEHYAALSEMKWGTVAKILHLPIETSIEHDYFYEVIHSEELKDNLSMVAKQLEKYISLEERLNSALSKLTERERQIMRLRQEGATLETVGAIIGVTRERIRQVEKTGIDKLFSAFNKIHLHLYIEHLINTSKTFTKADLVTMLNLSRDMELFILNYITKSKKFFIVHDRIIDERHRTLLDRLKTQISHNYGDVINVDELLRTTNSTEHEHNYIPLEELDVVLADLKYYRNNNIYICDKIRITSKIEYVFKYVIKGRMEITDENFARLQVIMQDVFGEMLENGKRPAIARMRDTPNLILVDRNTFMYYDLELVPEELVSEIEETLAQELSVEEVVTADTLYNRYKDKWQRYNIDNKFFLYSIIQHYFEMEYHIGFGNTLSIAHGGHTRIKLYSILHNYLLSHGQVSAKSQILEDLHWPTYKLEQMIARNADLLTVELEGGIQGVRLFSSLHATDEELIKLRSFMDKYMQDGNYIFPQDLMIEMEFDDELSEILVKYGIYKLYDFASLLKYLNHDLKGFQQFLYKKGSKFTIVEQVIQELYTDLMSRQDLANFLEKKGFSPTTLTSMINDLLAYKYFYPYTSYQYINANSVQVDKAILEELGEYLEKSFGEKLYISALDLVGFSNLTMVSEHPWTQYLIAQFAPQMGYQVINTTKDYRYDKLLLVKASSGIKKLDELAYQLISNEYDGNYHETALAKFLVDKKLAHSPKISYELKSSELFNFKELGFFELKGDT